MELKCIKKILATAFLMYALPASAGSVVGTVTKFGCHVNNSSMCYVELSGGNVNAGSCANTSIRWDGANANGKNAISLILTAMSTGQKLSILSDACYSGFPTITYIETVP